MDAEGGLKLLNELLAHPAPYQLIKDLATVVIENCAAYEARERDDDSPPPYALSPDN